MGQLSKEDVLYITSVANLCILEYPAIVDLDGLLSVSMAMMERTSKACHP